MPRIEAAVRSHPGMIRKNNEDNFFLNGVFMRAGESRVDSLYKITCKDKRQLYAVCDGMGGMNSGEKASLLAVTGLDKLLSAGVRRLPLLLQESIDIISGMLLSPSDGGAPSGCTLAAVYFDGSMTRVAHLGDSRVYFKRGNLALTQVTEDHSQAVWYSKQGVLSPEEAEIHPSRNVLCKYIGAPDQNGRTPDISDAMRSKRGDIFLICSDGLSNMMSVFEMDIEISSRRRSADICQSLVSLALERGGEDNITALLIQLQK